MAEREFLLFLLVLLHSSVHAAGDVLLIPNETNIVAYVNEKAVLPCRPASSKIQVTLYKGNYYSTVDRESAKINVGEQPSRNQTVTFDPEVGFTLDPVELLDVGTFRCIGTSKTEDDEDSLYVYYSPRIRMLSTRYLKFTLDVNTGHLLIAPPNNTIIVKEGSEAVLPCRPSNASFEVKLYREGYYGFFQMRPGKITSYSERRIYWFDDDEEEEEDEEGEEEKGDDDDDDDDVGDGGVKHKLSKEGKRGFIFTSVQYSDDDTYKCEATYNDQKEVMYFYLHVDETHLLRGITERYVTVHRGDNLVLPCKPVNQNATLKLYHTSEREITVGPVMNYNRTVIYEPNVGYTLTMANTSDAGSYRCDATLGKHAESAYFYVYVNTAPLLDHINNTYVLSNGSGEAVIPCITNSTDVKVELYAETSSARFTLVPQTEVLYGRWASYDYSKGFTLYYNSYMSSEHLLCEARQGENHDSLFFYWHSKNLLLHPGSRNIEADTGDKAVLPCRTADADTVVRLYIGATYYKRRQIKMGRQPHRNQTVTFDPTLGFTLDPVNPLDSGWYKCEASLDFTSESAYFYLEVRLPATIVNTSLSVNKSLVETVGHNMTMFCNSEGMPHPDTFWYKDDKPVVTDTSFELRDRNQSLFIKMLKPEHAGTYSCVVRNELAENMVKMPLIITDSPPVITRTDLNSSQNVTTKLKDSLTILCESQGKPEPKTLWFKDGNPVITDANVELVERNQSLTIKAVDVEHIGVYCCKVSNVNGEVQSEGKVTLEGVEPVRIIDTNLNVSKNLDVQLGTTLIVFCTSKGNPTPKTSWFKDGKPVVPDNSTVRLARRNQELYIMPARSESEGVYHCVANNGLAEVNVEGNVTVTEPAKIIESNLNVSRSIAVEEGTDLMMFCKSEGNPLPNITWFKDDKPLDIDGTVELKDNNQTLTIKGLKQEGKGKYRCVVQNQLATVKMVAVVDVTDDSSNSATTAVISVVCILLLLAMVAALIFYVRRSNVLYTLRQYMQLRKSQEDTTEDYNEFSNRLEEEYFSSPRSYRGDNDIGNLIVSECLPETSRPEFNSPDDYSNMSSVSNPSNADSLPSRDTGVRSVEMKTV